MSISTSGSPGKNQISDKQEKPKVEKTGQEQIQSEGQAMEKKGAQLKKPTLEKQGKVKSDKVKKSKKVKKKKQGFSPPNLYWRLTVAVIISLVFIGGTLFSSTHLRTLVGEVEKKRGQMVALEQREQNWKILSSSLKSVSQEKSQIEKALPKEDEIVDFIQKVEENGHGVSIEKFIFDNDQPQIDPNGFSYLGFTLEAKDSLKELEQFLSRILDMPYLVRPRLVDIDKVNEETSKMIFEAWLYVEPDFFNQGK